MITVFLMQAGFVLLEVGSSRQKHSRTVLFKNILNSIATCLAFWIVGFPLSVGQQGGIIGQYSWLPDNY